MCGGGGMCWSGEHRESSSIGDCKDAYVKKNMKADE